MDCRLCLLFIFLRREEEEEEEEEAPDVFLSFLFWLWTHLVIINNKSQQSKKFEFMVPRTQFIDDVWTFSLCRDRCVVLWYRKLWSFRSCSSSLAVDFPFVPQKLIPMVQSAQQIMEIPQLLLILVVDVLVARVVQILRCCRGEDLGAPTVAAR